MSKCVCVCACARAHAQVCIDITLIEPVMFLLQWIKTHVSFILGLVVTKRKRAATVHRRDG